MKRLLAVLMASAALTGLAHAADLPPLFKAPSKSTYTCTPASCSNFYVGGVLGGNVGNADIVANGLQNSIFAGGGFIGADVGYRFWNGIYYAAIENDVMLQSANNAGVIGFQPSGFMDVVQGKIGMSLAPLFGVTSTTPSPSQGPISVPQTILANLMSPYLVPVSDVIAGNGVQRYATGAGSEFAIGGRWSLDPEYLYVPAASGLKAANMALVKLHYNW